MMSKHATPNDQSDMMLYIAAALVVGLGIVWLLISQPWSSGAEPVAVADQAAAPRLSPATSAAGASAASAPGNTAGGAERSGGSGLDNPLRMAQLAYDAGMLIEPEDYSAWDLFKKALEEDPESVDARAGLSRVADDLADRGVSAIEQGRFDDARHTAGLITKALPEHSGAMELLAKIEALAPRPEPQRLPPAPRPEPAIEPASAQPVPTERVAEETPRAPQPQVVDPLDALHEAFGKAMTENRLLTPADDSAKFHVERMVALRPEDERVRLDRDSLANEMIARSAQSLEALDYDAARTWIDEAERLGHDSVAVAAARRRMTDARIATESAKLLPASALKVRNYVAPTYPRQALQREVEGWVDVQFTVAPDGTTTDIVVTDGSNNDYFREEAVEAVMQWEFEPRIFLGEAIAQHTYTRLRFVLGGD